MHPVRIGVMVAMVISCVVSSGWAAPPPAKPTLKLTKWLTNFDAATLLARKEKKIILCYFCGSDWEPFTQELEKRVMNTDMFRDWAAEHVILFQADFLRDKKVTGNTKGQNERLKQRYSIIRVPTFILMDYSGMPFARAGFDEAKLRDTEPKNEPRAWIKYLEETIKNRPPDEAPVRQKNLRECLLYAKHHFISAVLLISQGRGDREMGIKDDLMHNQQLVRFLNRNVSFLEIEWPYPSDSSPQSTLFRDWAAEQKIEPLPLQLVVWDMQTQKVNFSLKSIDPARAEMIIAMIEEHLPKIDYSGGWIEDFHKATAIAQQQKRCIFVEFMSMDSSEYSKKMEEEIIQTDEFQKYAKKHLVMVKIDFPTATTQPVALASQNKGLADLYAIRGYPTVVLLNPLGQKLADAKYTKGGPALLIKQVDAAVKADAERRAFLAGEQ